MGNQTTMETKYLYSMFELQDSLPTLRSSGAGSPITINFVNNSETAIKTFWVNYESGQQEYSYIHPKAINPQGTFSGHPWVLKLADNDYPFAAYVPPLNLPKDTVVTLTVQN